MTLAIAAEPGSYRDPSGRVYLIGDRVIRTVMPRMADDFAFVRSTSFFAKQTSSGRVITEVRADPEILGEAGREAVHVLEHPRLPFISHPYEWPFHALKAAAVLQLELYLDALDAGVMLSDASAYNIQFMGTRPIFIDSLSFRRYREGEFWGAHRQFCEQFLNPLLLRALSGVPYNAWYRGSLEGITTEDLARLVPISRWLSWNLLVHVLLPARLQHRKTARADAESYVTKRKLPTNALKAMLRGLLRWVERLEPASGAGTVWQDYAGDNSYSEEEALLKSSFVTEFAASCKPDTLWDIGCNTGVYAEVALRAGASRVIGFDADHGALDEAFARARLGNLDFLPLYSDAVNPSPDQGWRQQERRGFAGRAPADALLALAVVHHLVIGRNIPLFETVDWLVGLAPRGVIEFVPPDDPMVSQLLSLRENIFSDYTEENFSMALSRHARIVKSSVVSESGRRLYWFDRSPGDDQKAAQ